MIWICTLCLLAVAAWLFFNALNERRWVEAHSHDETVASDQGLFPSLTGSTGTGQPDGSGKVSIAQENSGFARAVTSVQQKTSNLGERLFESKAAAARISDPEQAPRSAREEDTFFGRAVAKIGQRVEKLDAKLDEKMKSASRATQNFSSSKAGNLLDTTREKIASQSGLVEQKMTNLKNRLAHSDSENENGTFTKAVSRVSAGIDKMESKLGEQMAKGREHLSKKNDQSPEDDLLTRVSAKIGAKVNELSDKNRNSD